MRMVRIWSTLIQQEGESVHHIRSGPVVEVILRIPDFFTSLSIECPFWVSSDRELYDLSPCS